MSTQPASSWKWPLIIVALLATNVVIVMITVFAAKSSDAAVVEEDYDTKALHYDDVLAARAKRDARGWRVEPVIVFQAEGAADANAGLLAVRVTDAGGVPMPGAKVRVQAFHNAHVRQAQKGECVEGDAGEFTLALRVEHEGRWTIRVRVEHGGDVGEYEFEKLVWRQGGGA